MTISSEKILFNLYKKLENNPEFTQEERKILGGMLADGGAIILTDETLKEEYDYSKLYFDTGKEWQDIPEQTREEISYAVADSMMNDAYDGFRDIFSNLVENMAIEGTLD